MLFTLTLGAEQEATIIINILGTKAAENVYASLVMVSLGAR